MIKPLDILIRAIGVQQATSDIKSLGPAAAQAGAAIKQGTAQAWSPFISELKKAEIEQKRLADIAQKTANDQVAAARRASAAVISASKDQKQAARDASIAARQQADEAIQNARRVADAYKQAAQATVSAQKNLGSQITSNAPRAAIAGGTSSQIGTIEGGVRAQAAQEVARFGSGIFNSSSERISSGLKIAQERELQLKTIEALSGSVETAKKEFEQMDDAALKSVYSLRELTTAGKNLEASKIFSERNLRAVDDVAAVGKERGITPAETAFALSRLQNGDFGEGFQRFRELGINRKDLEGQGLTFSRSNEFQGTAEQAVEGVVKAIEKKFGGLSEKLATETGAGAISNLEDAQDRYSAKVQGELIPTQTLLAKSLTEVTKGFTALPEPLQKLWAFTQVGVTGLGQLAFSGLDLVANIALVRVAFGTLTTANTVAGASATTGAAGVNTLSVSILTRLVPAMLTAGIVIAKVALVALAVAAILYGLDKLLHYKEDKQLRENIAAGDALAPQRLEEVNRHRKKKGDAPLSMEQFIAWENDTSGNWTDPTKKQTANTDFDPDAAQAQIGNITADLGNLRSQQSTTSGGVPSLSTAAFTIADSSSGAMPSLGNADSYTSQIRSLEDQIITAKGEENKAKREQLQSQLRSLRRNQQDARRAEADQKRADKKAESDAAKAERRENKEEGYGVDIDRNRARLKFNAQIDSLQLALDKAKDDGDAAKVKALTLQIETAKAEQDYAAAQEQSAKEAITDIEKAKATLQIAKDNRADDLRRAQVTAERAALNVNGKDGSKWDEGIRAILRGRQIGGGISTTALNPAGAAAIGASSNRSSSPPRVSQGPFRQESDGSYKATLELEIPYQGIGNLEVH